MLGDVTTKGIYCTWWHIRCTSSWAAPLFYMEIFSKRSIDNVRKESIVSLSGYTQTDIQCSYEWVLYNKLRIVTYDILIWYNVMWYICLCCYSAMHSKFGIFVLKMSRKQLGNKLCCWLRASVSTLYMQIEEMCEYVVCLDTFCQYYSTYRICIICCEFLQ